MDINKNIPKYLVEKYNLVNMVVLTAAFSLVFINVYSPYGSRDWINGMTDFQYFLLSSFLVLLGMCVVAISRVILYHICKKSHETIPLWQYLAWIAAEIVVMSFSFTLLEMFGFDDHRPFSQLLKISFGNTAFILLIPYGVLWLYFSWKDKDKRLQAIADYRSAHERDTHIGPDEMITFHDLKGEIKFSVKSADLIYIKGADNYITIHYADGQRTGMATIRATMKSVEADLKDRGIIRCHRSYLVNRQHIKLFERTKEGFMVKLDTPTPMSIPVSKNYIGDVYELFA